MTAPDPKDPRIPEAIDITDASHEDLMQWVTEQNAALNRVMQTILEVSMSTLKSTASPEFNAGMTHALETVMTALTGTEQQTEPTEQADRPDDSDDNDDSDTGPAATD